MRWINYQHFHYFWKVAKAGSVTKASNELRLAQPTISAQLKLFEQTLGEKLFIREGRHLTLTEVGKIALQYAEQVFPLCDELLHVLDGKSPIIQKKLKIGISDVVPKVVAYKVLEPVFTGKLVDSVICYEDRTERLLGELATSGLDLVVSDAPVPSSMNVKAYNHHLGDCGISFLGTSGLVRKYKSNFPKSLANAPLLLPTNDSVIRSEIDRWLDSIGVSPNIVAQFQDSALMKFVAAEGVGIVPVPMLVEREVSQIYKLRLVGSTNAVRERFFLISVERRIKNSVVKSVAEHAKARLAKVGPTHT